MHLNIHLKECSALVWASIAFRGLACLFEYEREDRPSGVSNSKLTMYAFMDNTNETVYNI